MLSNFFFNTKHIETKDNFSKNIYFETFTYTDLNFKDFLQINAKLKKQRI